MALTSVNRIRWNTKLPENITNLAALRNSLGNWASIPWPVALVAFRRITASISWPTALRLTRPHFLPSIFLLFLRPHRPQQPVSALNAFCNNGNTFPYEKSHQQTPIYDTTSETIITLRENARFNGKPGQ